MLRLEATHGAVFVLQNPTTGTIVGPTQLVTLSVRYESVRLAESVLLHFVALFEDCVFELLRLWLSSYPGAIPNKDKKQVNLAMLIDAPDRVALLQTFIDRELNALRYERPTAWFRYLNDRVKLGCPTDEQVERLAEIKASRDILAHNRGVVNQTYLDKAGSRSRYKIGQRLEVPEPDLNDSWLLIRGMVQDLAMAAIGKA